MKSVWLQVRLPLYWRRVQNPAAACWFPNQSHCFRSAISSTGAGPHFTCCVSDSVWLKVGSQPIAGDGVLPPQGQKGPAGGSLPGCSQASWQQIRKPISDVPPDTSLITPRPYRPFNCEGWVDAGTHSLSLPFFSPFVLGASPASAFSKWWAECPPATSSPRHPLQAFSVPTYQMVGKNSHWPSWGHMPPCGLLMRLAVPVCYAPSYFLLKSLYDLLNVLKFKN